ncbi:hypothetical protein NEOLEDRAFT_1135492 [Neolentinus lepideus HHB14362 ss-1]|uniref:Altered inheritance of mitochondria protein 9, mitochondrial n=1 Tax=Neolentinus lepideus HHB14362 ss-1 TaxID=1314782 RepID=A0A165RUD1_9AGAM|nr:hypothetical protein NEOLEDRAFT_1135492 [Neolentinus lepideus HHB14362 ss-1]
MISRARIVTTVRYARHFRPPSRPVLLSALRSLTHSRPISVIPFTSGEKFELFNFTAGRWLYNESEQNAARHVEFDVEALQALACQALGATACLKFKKVYELEEQRIFLLKGNNGKDALIRIPFSFAGPPKLSTASEVATMEFMRNVLGVPAPRVLGWSADATRNSIGAEYIIVERVPGTTFPARWPTLSAEQLDIFLSDLLDIETAFERAPFSQIGSLFFAEDVDPELQSRPLFSDQGEHRLDARLLAAADKYRVGPLVNEEWWREGRINTQADHGPWPDATSYYLAAAKLELAWLKHSGFTDTTHPLLPMYHRLIDSYRQTIPKLMPMFTGNSSAPTIWHPSISLSSIVFPWEGDLHINGLINWRNTIIGPYFAQASFPRGLIHRPSMVPEVPLEMEKPELELPADTGPYSIEEQQKMHIESRWHYLHQAYQYLITKTNKRRAYIQSLPGTWQLDMLPPMMVRCSTDGFYDIFDALVSIWDDWDRIEALTEEPCPVGFSSDEITFLSEASMRNKIYRHNSEQLRLEVGEHGDGFVINDSYDETKKRCALLAEQWDEEEKCGPFPYQDGMFSSFLS